MIRQVLNRYLEKRATKKAKRLAMERELMNRWDQEFFESITFPILIIDNSSYAWISVSDIEEYFYDVDINHYFINEACELIDIKGNVYGFREIEEGLEGSAWIPNNKISDTNIEKIKEKLSPRYIQIEKDEFENSSNIEDLIYLLLTN